MLGLSRLVAELYNFSAVTSALIFEILYHFINFAHEIPSTSTSSTDVTVPVVFPPIHEYDPRIPSELDPPEDGFRAQVGL